ncbi:hypothetical protein B0H17DRAFT_1148198 [Mycena rosella]|uniref:Uncharacterized protein n=1 Tax=Mycena rosella TaxID=1033263 RepID=A0AAD7CDN9_MYCRO|nr:hypothetical protein B0H17DRAFT_1148198 [Mycena rosella]
MCYGTGTAPVRRVPSNRGDGNGRQPYLGHRAAQPARLHFRLDFLQDATTRASLVTKGIARAAYAPCRRRPTADAPKTRPDQDNSAHDDPNHDALPECRTDQRWACTTQIQPLDDRRLTLIEAPGRPGARAAVAPWADTLTLSLIHALPRPGAAPHCVLPPASNESQDPSDCAENMHYERRLRRDYYV